MCRKISQFNRNEQTRKMENKGGQQQHVAYIVGLLAPTLVQLMDVGIAVFNKPRPDDLKARGSLRLASAQYVCVASERNPLNGLRHVNQGFFYYCISEVSVYKSDLIITIISLLPVIEFLWSRKRAQNKNHKKPSIAVGLQRPPDLSYR